MGGAVFDFELTLRFDFSTALIARRIFLYKIRISQTVIIEYLSLFCIYRVSKHFTSPSCLKISAQFRILATWFSHPVITSMNGKSWHLSPPRGHCSRWEKRELNGKLLLWARSKNKARVSPFPHANLCAATRGRKRDETERTGQETRFARAEE